MSTGLLERPATSGAANGGVPARRAVIRWAWRMFRREWRQQLLVLGLIVVAVAAIVVGSAVAHDTPPAANAGFGTATDMATFQAPDPHLASQIAALRDRFSPVDVIENQTVAIPGSINTYDLRAQDPHGRYGQPLLSLVSGHYPAGPGQVAVTSGVASALHLNIGSTLRSAGTSRRVVGIVQNPQSLLDEFALVVPGQVTAPSQVTVLFDAPGVAPHSIGPNVSTPHSVASAAGQQPTQPDHDRARAGHGGHAAHRAGLGGRLHRAGPAPAALAGHAGRARRHRPEHPAGGPDQRRAGRRDRCGGGPGAGPGRLAGLPADRRIGRASPDRPVPAALGGDRPGHGAGRAGHLLRRVPAGPGHHPDPGGDRAGRAARPAQAGAPHRAARPDRAGRGGGPVRLHRQE